MADRTNGRVMELLKVKRLRKSFGDQPPSVDDVSFTVRKGEVVAFLGPNGAGKSTTMRMISGYLDPDEGDVEIVDCSILRDRRKAQAFLGYLAEGAPLYPDLTVRAFLSFLARTHGFGLAQARSAVAAAAEAAGVAEVMRTPIETLSKGYRRRTALAGAIIHDPPVLVLDEPTDGLDPNQKAVVRDLVARMAPEKAILISTHQLDEVEAMCARAVVIAKGVVVADAPVAILSAELGGLSGAFARLTRRDQAA